MLYCILAPYGEEQSDLVHRIAKDKKLEKLPTYKYVFHVRMCVCMCVRACVRVCVCIVYVCTCMHTHNMRVYVHMCVALCIRVYICMCYYGQTYMHIVL